MEIVNITNEFCDNNLTLNESFCRVIHPEVPTDVLVYFHATWYEWNSDLYSKKLKGILFFLFCDGRCGHCKALEPVIVEVAQYFKGQNDAHFSLFRIGDLFISIIVILLK